jgi:hypothetical protein
MILFCTRSSLNGTNLPLNSNEGGESFKPLCGTRMILNLNLVGGC